MIKKFDKKIMFAVWTCHNKFYHMYQMWDAPLRKLFREVVSFDPQEVLYNEGKDEMNRKFLAVIEKEKPDYLFTQLIYEEFYIDTLLKIKEVSPKTQFINFNGDDDNMFYDYNLLFFPLIDYFFTTQPDYLKEYSSRGMKAFLMFGADPEVFKPLNLERIYDVTFVGTVKSDRAEYIRYLVENGIKVRIFGSGWEKYEEFKKIWGGKVSDEEFKKIINQSKINIVFSKNYQGKTHVLDRLPEISFTKSFSLVEFSKGYYELFTEGKDIATFQTKEDLLEKIMFYLKNEPQRKRIAKNIYEKSLKNYSLVSLIINAFNKIIMEGKKKEFAYPTSSEMNVAHISVSELNEDLNKIIPKLDGADFVSFASKKSKDLKFKETFQVLSLNNSKKNASCCDYYVESSFLGNYLVLQTKHSYETLERKEFVNLLRIETLLVRKQYFIKNYEKFRNYKDGLGWIYGDLSFVSYPFVKIKGVKVNSKLAEHSFLPLYENVLRSLRWKKKIYSSLYTYLLFIQSVFDSNLNLKGMWNKYIFKELKPNFKKGYVGKILSKN